jgi:hypothetical protein
MLNLRKGMRQTRQKIGKRGWQWDLEEIPLLIRITNIRRTEAHEIAIREQFGVRKGSEKP